ncbi:hypothetical protein ACFSCZ_09220 [Siminovitchia sediminis]|uniref:Uncharacterized protein n=1 Tax=Siminovitchia sediminis TaxID=1274353 RepID=A0ABW4KGR3_9BACI
MWLIKILTYVAESSNQGIGEGVGAACPSACSNDGNGHEGRSFVPEWWFESKERSRNRKIRTRVLVSIKGMVMQVNDAVHERRFKSK